MNDARTEQTSTDERVKGSVRGAGSATPESFIAELLSAQCATAPADAGAIVRVLAANEAQVLGLHPATRPGQSSPAWLSRAIEVVVRHKASTSVEMHPLEMSDAQISMPVGTLIVIPLGSAGGDGSRAFGVYLARGPSNALGLVAQRLRLSSGLIETIGLRSEVVACERRAAELSRVLESLTASGEHDRFSPAVMAFLNSLASVWACSRVSLGFVRGRRVSLAAMSHTERLVRKTSLAQDIEAAMEECADQDIEIRHPSSAEDGVIARTTAQLAQRHASAAVLSIPLRRGDVIKGVLTMERESGPEFAPAEVASLRLLADLVSPRLSALDRYARWAGPRMLGDLRDVAALFVGPRHTWLRVSAVGIVLAILGMTFIKGTFRVEGSFRLEASDKRVIAAPFDGYIRDVSAEVGDLLAQPGLILAKLDDAELRLELAGVKAERATHEREAAVAQRERKEAEAQIARAKAEQAQARIDLLEHQISQASLTAPVAGIVLSGDLMRRRGAPVRIGDVLYEVAPLESLRADLFVPEDRAADVKPGQRGELATAAFPERRIGFTVERLDPAAEVRKERNVFRARLKLDEPGEWMRPGMEGVARVDIDRRAYGSIWFRRAIDWVRMKMWI